MGGRDVGCANFSRKFMKTLLQNLLATVLVFSCFSGCTAIRQTDAPMKEKTLLSAGFRVKPVNTNKREADLAALTPYKIQMQTHKGQALYLYADPKNNVIYAGGPKQYAAYKKMAKEQTIVSEREVSNSQWQYWTATYGEGMAGNPMVIY